MRYPTPELAHRPAPSGKYPSFSAYVAACIHQVGTADALGQLLGFSSGTRVSDWKHARGGRPSCSSCLRLADLTGDDPTDILIMAGHDDEATLLRGFLSTKREAPVSVLLQPKLAIESALQALQYAKQALEVR